MPWRLKSCPRCRGDVYWSAVDEDYHCLACGMIVHFDRVSVGDAANRLGISRAELRARLREKHFLVYPDGVQEADLAALVAPTLPKVHARGRPRHDDRSRPRPTVEWFQDTSGHWRNRVIMTMPTPKEKE